MHKLLIVYSLIFLKGAWNLNVNGERRCRYYGSDLAPGSQFDMSISQNVVSATDCCNMCLGNPSCKGFVHNIHQACHLKNTSSPLVGSARDLQVTSGIIEDFNDPEIPIGFERGCHDIGPNDMDWGRDLIKYTNTMSYDDCCQKCRVNRDCNGFVFRGEDCWLKYTIGDIIASPDSHSGTIVIRKIVGFMAPGPKAKDDEPVTTVTVSPDPKLENDGTSVGDGVERAGTNLTWVYILGSLLLLLLIAILFLTWRNSLKNKDPGDKEKLTENEIDDFYKGMDDRDAGVGFAPRYGSEPTNTNPDTLPYDTSYEISTDLLAIDQKTVLGSGQYGVVYGGCIIGRDGATVAIKTTKPNCNLSYFKSLLSELKLLVYIGKHGNIIELIGANTENIRLGIVYIVMEQCQLGDLQTHLRNLYKKLMSRQTHVSEIRLCRARDKERTLKDFFKWSCQIAHAMEYISSKKVIHGDLAARNILLTLDETAKLSDFGLSRKLYNYLEYAKTKQEPLPWKWMALESLKTLTFSTKSDVWSYGVLLWEIFSFGQIPYGGLSWDTDFAHKLEVDGLRLSKPDMAPEPIYQIMRSCWENEPNDRSDFVILKMKFEDYLNVINSLK